MNIVEAVEYLKLIKEEDLKKLGYVYGKEAIDTILNVLEQKIY